MDFQKILELSNTRLGLVQIKLEKMQIEKSYVYQYGNLKNRVSASSSKKLLILERMFSMDEYTEYYKSRRGKSSFTKDFLSLSYEIDGNQKNIAITDVTPKEIDNVWVFEVPQELEIARHINLIVTVRGTSYKMIII